MTNLPLIAELSDILAESLEGAGRGVALMIGRLARAEGEPREVAQDAKPAYFVAPEINTPLRPATSPKARKGPVDPDSLAGQILDFLPTMLKAFPKGPTSKLLAEKMDSEEHHIRSAMRDLHDSGQAIRVRRHDSPAWHLIPKDYAAPPEDLTETQNRVLEVVKAAADEAGIAQISRRQISDSASISLAAVPGVILALYRKGYLQEIETGKGTTPSKFKVLAVGGGA